MKAITFLKIITLINVLVATVFSLAGLLNPLVILPPEVSSHKAIMIFAAYASARTLPLAAVVIVSIFGKHWNTLTTLAFLAGTIQFLDGFIGLYQQDFFKAAGPFFIATIQFFAIYIAQKSTAKIQSGL